MYVSSLERNVAKRSHVRREQTRLDPRYLGSLSKRVQNTREVNLKIRNESGWKMAEMFSSSTSEVKLPVISNKLIIQGEKIDLQQTMNQSFFRKLLFLTYF